MLEDISINIDQGDIFGIIGQSGAGKSTLLRCINGLEKYNGGSITVEGRRSQVSARKNFSWCARTWDDLSELQSVRPSECV